MAGKKLIVAYDGSTDSKKALTMAVDYAKEITSEIYILSVYDVHYALADGAYYSEFAKESEQAFEEKMTLGKKFCEEQGIAVTTEVLQGDPADEIIKYARRQKADLIITGTRGLGGFAQLLLGSVAHRLVTYSPIPVLVVK
ncbi:MAG: universal stress protein [Sporomusaceae bacterium]|nr:universal stress protein [Sporomusaceae bacterium]